MVSSDEDVDDADDSGDLSYISGFQRLTSAAGLHIYVISVLLLTAKTSSPLGQIKLKLQHKKTHLSLVFHPADHSFPPLLVP